MCEGLSGWVTRDLIYFTITFFFLGEADYFLIDLRVYLRK